MKIRFGKNDVIDTKAVNAGIEEAAEAYVPGQEEGYDYLDMLVEACYSVSSGGEKELEFGVDSNGAITVKRVNG